MLPSYWKITLRKLKKSEEKRGLFTARGEHVSYIPFFPKKNNKCLIKTTVGFNGTTQSRGSPSQGMLASWTVACQVPLSMGFPGKNTGVGCHFLLQGIFRTQALNPRLLHWQAASSPLSYHGSLQQGIIWPQMSTVLQLRNSGAEILNCHQTGSCVNLRL